MFGYVRCNSRISPLKRHMKRPAHFIPSQLIANNTPLFKFNQDGAAFHLTSHLQKYLCMMNL